MVQTPCAHNFGHKFYDKIDKINCLKRNNLALWDVFQPNGKKNDIDTFLSQNPQIKEIIVFGKGVLRYYKPNEAIKEKIRLTKGDS